jgi:hypothetical protein
LPPGLDIDLNVEVSTPTTTRLSPLASPFNAILNEEITIWQKKQNNFGKLFEELKFKDNIISVLVQEFTNAKLEKRDLVPMTAQMLKQALLPANRPPKKSPHQESFTSLVSKISEVEYKWIRRQNQQGELIDPEKGYFLSKTFLSNFIM